MEQVLSVSWRFSARAPLGLRCWEQECVLYDPTTGDTHLMARADAELLDRFQTTPLTVRSFETLQADFKGNDLQEVLADFERRAFITRV